MIRVKGILGLLVVLRTYGTYLKGKRVVIQFNSAYQPTSPGSEKFRRICGKIIRNGQFVQLHGNWWKLPTKGKEDMWRTLTV
jgi:hypothetical protein